MPNGCISCLTSFCGNSLLKHSSCGASLKRFYRGKLAKSNLLQRRDLDELTRNAAKDYLEQLRREVRRHDYLYYVQDRPEISDQAYDRLFDILKVLEQRLPDLITADSPTQRVGAKPQEQFRQLV